MKKFVLLSVTMILMVGLLQSQTIEEYKAMKAEKEAQIGALQGEVAGIKNKIAEFPGWEIGSFGTLGFNLSSFSNWQKGANPNSVSSAILASLNGFANYDESKYFWRNSGNLNLGWQKLDTDTDDNADADFEKVADVFKVTSLFGYKISEKIAASALGEYNTSILTNFNNPGILDLGVGFTWLPIPDMVVVIHPLNYHFVFGDNPAFENALGAKIVVDYTTEIGPGVTWRSNLTSFLSYKDTDPSLNEYTFTNGLGFNVWKGIGVGIEFAVRKAEVESSDSQSYWVVGLSYAL